MRLDGEDVRLLREIAAGKQNFAPEGQDEAAFRAFDRIGDKLIALVSSGLVDASYNFVMSNHTSSAGKYYAIHVDGLTEAGKKELARREPPDASVVNAVRGKVEQEFRVRDSSFGKKVGEIRRMGGAPSGSRVALLLEAAVEQEYRERGSLVLSVWKQVIRARRLELTDQVVELILQEADVALTQHCEKLREAATVAREMWGKSKRVHPTRLDPPWTAYVQNWSSR